MTTATNPWAVTDHDPTSNLAAAGPSTTAVLAYARGDIHTAVACADDPYRRRQYALSARDYAVTVLLALVVGADEVAAITDELQRLLHDQGLQGDQT